MRFVNICNPENRRREFFDRALSSIGFPPAVICPWQDLSIETLLKVLTRDTILRIESPGENFQVWKQLVEAGMSLDQIQSPPITEDFGRIQYMRPWFGGFVHRLDTIRDAIHLSGCTVMNRPASIRLMFDKYACQKKLASSGISVPALLPPATTYDELRDIMRQSGTSRVFIKPLYSSSASGVIAYRTNGPNEEATSSIEVIENNGELKFYNSLKINRYKRHSDVRRVIEFILQEGAYAEQWIPKAILGREVFDVRIVVVDDEVAFILPRISQGPITNLHLGNRRGSVDDLFRLLGEDSFEEMCAAARKAAETVGAFYAGVDVLIPMGLGKPRILEINAFGDLLPGLIGEQGDDTYTHELKMFMRKYTLNA